MGVGQAQSVVELFPSIGPIQPHEHTHITVRSAEKIVEDSDWPGGPEILEKLERAVALAEELSAPPADRWVARRISDELIPALYEARTYLEVGRLAAPEVRYGVAAARSVASILADSSPRYAPLHSSLRILQEEAGLAARGV